VSWMTESSAKALSYLISESSGLKLVKLKDKALVNGLGIETKLVMIKRYKRIRGFENGKCLILKM
jgi:hypothetical protein